MAVRGQLAVELSDLDPHLAQWDELAVQSGRPYCCPAWTLAWWRHAVSKGTELRVVMAYDEDRLVAIAPFCVTRWRGMWVYRLLCAGMSARIGPLPAEPESEEHVRVIAEAVAEAEPAPDIFRFEGIDVDSPWPKLLADSWPGRRPHVRVDFQLDAAIVPIEDGYDAWLASRSRNFRKGLGRVRRRLDERGARLRLSTAAELDADLPDLFRLHHARWEERGGSGNLDPAIEAMMRDCAETLLPLGRFRLFILEAEGKAISADLFIDAGRDTAAWGGGFDPEWSKFGPGLVTQAAAFEDSASRGHVAVDLGEGEESYKQDIGGAERPVAWMTLFPRKARYPLSWLQMVPYQVKNRLRDRVRQTSPETRDRLRRIRGLVSR